VWGGGGAVWFGVWFGVWVVGCRGGFGGGMRWLGVGRGGRGGGGRGVGLLSVAVNQLEMSS